MRTAAVILPDLGTGPDTQIVVSYWFASRGETVWEGDRLVEVLVGPATFDVPVPATGRLARIRAREDDLVAPGSVLGHIAIPEVDGDDGTGEDRGSGKGGDGEGPRDRSKGSGRRSP
jgi:pyruvate/2-oxoglutarate dehydrogenase complex dihydrolipoamide acyltransferase (E2) component